MNYAQLQTRLNVLDRYITHLKAGNASQQSFAWEEDLEPAHCHERQVILGAARAAGCCVALTTDGFTISL